MSRITDTVTALARSAAQELGLSIWDVEYLREAGRWFLRIYIDKEDGVSIDDCEALSRALDPILDEADPIPESYVFEVSSAGLDRELRKPEHFKQFLGSSVEARLYSPLNGAKSFIGTLTGYENDAVTLETAGGTITFEKAQLAQVRVHLD